MAPSTTRRIWIGGLDRDVSVEDVRAMFEPFGSIDEGIFLRVDLDHQVGGEAVVT
jgi:RNA recognition motif-containing protein